MRMTLSDIWARAGVVTSAVVASSAAIGVKVLRVQFIISSCSLSALIFISQVPRWGEVTRMRR
jgi:hypothetical protein